MSHFRLKRLLHTHFRFLSAGMPTALLAITVFFSCSVSIPERSGDEYRIAVSYPENTLNDGQAAELQSALDAACREGAVGISLLVDGPDGFWAGASGFADVQNGVALKPEHLFRIGSVSKLYLGVLAVVLEKEGKLSLDIAASKYLSQEVTRRVENSGTATIRQFLTHTSGVRDYINPLMELSDFSIYFDIHERLSFSIGTLDEALSYVYDKPALFAPGARYSYSNTGYVLAGKTVESVEGRPVWESMKEKVFSPLGLEATVYDPALAPPQGLVRGYEYYGGTDTLVDSTETEVHIATPDGSICSNVYEVARFYRALFTEKVFGAETTEEILPSFPTIPENRRSR